MKMCEIITLSYYQYRKVIYGDTYEDCLKTLIANLSNDYTIFGVKRTAQGDKCSMEENGIVAASEYTFSDDSSLVYQTVKSNMRMKGQEAITLQVLELDDNFLNKWCEQYVSKDDLMEFGICRRIFARNRKGNILTLTISDVEITDIDKVAIYIEEEEK